MQIVFYKCSSEKNCLNKVLENEITLDGAIRGESNVISPQIMVQMNPIEYDYVYIPEWRRYYFITDIVCYRSNAFVVKLSIDVLMSYKTEILQMTGVVSRLTSGSAYASRDLLVSCKEECREFDFGTTPFKRDGTYVLITQGGDVNG